MNLVGGVSVPDDQLAVLRSGNEMSPVCRPVHSVDLGEMTFESALSLHCKTRQGLGTLARNITDCRRQSLVFTSSLLCQDSFSGSKWINIRVVSANSSFFFFMRSFKASASLLAMEIFCCTDSALPSAISTECCNYVSCPLGRARLLMGW